MNTWIELVKACVRPFIVVWGSVLYGICIVRGIEVPPVLAGMISAVILEYFGERAIRRWKGPSE